MNNRLLILSCMIFLLIITTNTASSKSLRVASGDSKKLKESFQKSLDGDTILVEPGTYTGNYNFLGKAILLKSIAGPESTIVDGNANGSVFTFNHREDTTSIIDGFTIRNGSGTLMKGLKTKCGGGVFKDEEASCKIRNCIFKENVVGSVLPDEVGYGGGIGTFGEGWIIVEDCILKSNSAGHGAGAYFSHHSGRFFRNRVEKNTAFGYFAGNYGIGGYGGGVMIILLKENCTFTVCFNFFIENKCTNHSKSWYNSSGGAVDIAEYNIYFFNNYIENNQAQLGGGLYIGGAENDEMRVYNNFFINNRAVPDFPKEEYGGQGGAIFSNIGYCRPWIYNNTFWGNGAFPSNTKAGEGGTILYYYDQGHSIYNNIIAHTLAAEAVKINSTLPHDYNCFWDNKDGDYIYWVTPGPHDIFKNPDFSDSLFNLKPDSPCIDAGINMGLPFRGKAPDMGAVEYPLNFSIDTMQYGFIDRKEDKIPVKLEKVNDNP